MEQTIRQAEIGLKLLSSGRYIWTITLEFPINDKAGGIKEIKEIDRILKEEFPEYAKRGSGRSVSIEE